MRTSGASDDIKKATEIARKMVCQWGMSEIVGPLSIGKKDEEVFVGRGYGAGEAHSEKVAQDVDSEISQLVKDGYDKALKVLTDHKSELEAIAEALLIKETITSSEISRLRKGENIVSDAEMAAYEKRKQVAKNWTLDKEEEIESSNLNQNKDNNSPIDPIPQAT